MFGSSILEVAIGLVLVYLLLSLICSAIQESLEAWLKIRASHLEMGLRELLHDSKGTELVRDLYNHPMIFGLFRGEYDPAKVRGNFTSKLPTYIPPANFAVALIDTLVRGPVQRDLDKKEPPPTGELSIDSLRAAVVNSVSLNASVQRVLLLALDSAQGDLAKAQASSLELAQLYYARGRTIIPPVRTVTNAPSNLFSWHGYCLAVDVISVAHGWDRPVSWFADVAESFRKFGCKWGGDWKFKDLPHFQWGPCKPSPSDRARELIRTEGMEAVWRAVGAD